MKTINIVITSADDNHRLKQTEIDLYNETHEDKIKLSLYLNNKSGLPTVYNKHLYNIINYENIYDYVIFMHGDVYPDLDNLICGILNCNNKYDIIGFAGTKTIDVHQTPLSWFTASRNHENKRYGRINHDYDGNSHISFYNSHSPSVIDTEVITVDGLCMVLTKQTVNTGIKFDEQFSFDFYDFDFCLAACLVYKLKIGCLVEELRHLSVGRGILKDKYLAAEKLFRQKWDF